MTTIVQKPQPKTKKKYFCRAFCSNLLKLLSFLLLFKSACKSSIPNTKHFIACLMCSVQELGLLRGKWLLKTQILVRWRDRRWSSSAHTDTMRGKLFNRLYGSKETFWGTSGNVSSCQIFLHMKIALNILVTGSTTAALQSMMCRKMTLVITTSGLIRRFLDTVARHQCNCLSQVK